MKITRIIAFAMLIVSSLVFALPTFAQDDGSGVTTDGTSVIIDTDQAAEQVIQLTESTASGIMNTLNTFLSSLSIPQNDIVLLTMLILGVLFLVAGWRIYNWVIVLSGALVGGTLAIAALNAFATEPTVITELIAFAIGAVIGGALGYFVYYGAVFVIGVYFGIVLTTLVAESLGLLPVPPLVMLVVAILGGIIMLGLSFELLVILASLLGAQLIVLALGLTPATLWLLGLVVVGMFIQISLAKRSGYGIRRRPTRNMLD
ncbi:MAG: hypothetical protein AAFN11_08580 [Chloroflexota bacterium]